MFVSYDVSLELVRSLRPIVAAVRPRSRDLADQLERAGTSVVLNLAEGSRRRGGDTVRFYAYAHGSAREIKGALDVAEAWGWATEATSARAILDRLLALLWRLTH